MHSSKRMYKVFSISYKRVSHGTGLARLLLANLSPTDYLLVTHSAAGLY